MKITRKDCSGAYLHGFHKRPILNGILILAIYWVMDDLLLNVTDHVDKWQIILSLGMTLMIFYLYYVLGYIFDCYPAALEYKDIPSNVKNRKKYVMTMFYLLLVLTITIPLGYDTIITKWIPILNQTYYPSQVLLLVCIAPILEELVFRYFLYDQWARIKYGPIKGMIVTGFLFVICHPVTDINSMILYWVPTILFYLIYDSFGLYGSILAHILFNLIAL